MKLGNRTRTTEGSVAGYVDNGSLVAFLEDVSGQQQTDALYSTLLAQLAASKKFNREEEPESWYKTYQSTLSAVGWVLSDVAFKRYEAANTRFTASEVTIEQFEQFADEKDIAAVSRLLEGFALLPDDDSRVVLFNGASTRDSKGNKSYRSVLEMVGWVVPEYTFNQFKGSTATFSADEVIIKLLESIATQDDLAVITETITAIKELSSGDEKVKLFDTSSTSLSKGNFQVGSVGESDGVLVMNIGTFYFSTDRSVTNLLVFSFENSKTSFFQSAQTMNLDEDVYGKVRQQIIDKLGENASTQIANLDI